MKLSTTLGRLRMSFGRLIRGDLAPECCCGDCKTDGDCPPPAGEFAVCCNGTCKNTRDDTGQCTRPDGSTFEATYDECGRDNQSNSFTLCPCSDRVASGSVDPEEQWCKDCVANGGTCCPEGCCPEPNWVCCKDRSVFCAASPCDCPEPGGSPSPERIGFGPGTELKRLLSLLGFKATKNCKCNQYAREMNENEAREDGWCERNIETIVGWLRGEAKKRRLPFVDAAARLVIRRAIARHRRNIA